VFRGGRDSGLPDEARVHTAGFWMSVTGLLVLVSNLSVGLELAAGMPDRELAAAAGDLAQGIQLAVAGRSSWTCRFCPGRHSGRGPGCSSGSDGASRWPALRSFRPPRCSSPPAMTDAIPGLPSSPMIRRRST
jgi:hypothetical protein